MTDYAEVHSADHQHALDALHNGDRSRAPSVLDEAYAVVEHAEYERATTSSAKPTTTDPPLPRP
jgi:hypothetical protein